MEMIMRYKVSFDNKGFNEEDSFDKTKHFIDLGGNTFIINKMEVPFDFGAFGYDLNIQEDKVYLEFESGEGFLWNDYELDECFFEEYEKLGLSKENITAKFLASTDKIVEMSLCWEDMEGVCHSFINLEYEYIEFEDLETGKYYFVSNEALKTYNESINEIMEV